MLRVVAQSPRIAALDAKNQFCCSVVQLDQAQLALGNHSRMAKSFFTTIFNNGSVAESGLLHLS